MTLEFMQIRWLRLGADHIRMTNYVITCDISYISWCGSGAVEGWGFSSTTWPMILKLMQQTPRWFFWINIEIDPSCLKAQNFPLIWVPSSGKDPQASWKASKRLGTVALTYNPSTLGGQGRVDCLSVGVWEQPGQCGETPSLQNYKN